jgi:ribosomal protein S18 acetylase RimI-like enzyme
MNSVEVRPWTDADLSDVRRVTWETWLDAYSGFIPVEDLRSYFDEHYSLEALRAIQQSPENGGFVALVDGVTAGFVRTHREEGRFYVSSLYVLPSCQGRGAGSLLMEAAENQARSLGVNEVWLGVMEQNVRTLQWYRTLGFVFDEEAPFVMGKSSVNHFIGHKKIRTDS